MKSRGGATGKPRKVDAKKKKLGGFPIRKKYCVRLSQRDGENLGEGQT